MRITGTRLVGLFALVTTLGGSVVEASTISWGTPVDGIGSSTTVGDFGNWYDSTPDGVSNPTDHWVKYYIPLTEPYSGTYGDGTTGMQSDYIQNGCGPGTSNVCGYLDVYLQFEPIAPLPLESALMSFEFADLDIAPINDPWFFFESVRFYSAEGTAISDEITGLELGTGETNGIEWNAYQNLPEGMESTDPEADDWPLFVDFYGTEFTNLITDPFWVKLKFAVQDIPSWVSGSNTAKYFSASLTTESMVVPEPATLFLVGSGIIGIGLRTRRRRRARNTRPASGSVCS